MIDSRFFKNYGPFSLQQIAELGECELGENADPNQVIHNLSTLEAAGEGDLAMLHNPQHYLQDLKATKATAVIVEAKYSSEVPRGTMVLLSSAPYRAFARISSAFYPPSKHEGKGIHPTAIVPSSAQIGEGCQIGPYTIIGEDVVIGKGSMIVGHVTIHKGVTIGENCHIGAQSVLMCCQIGNHVHCDPGVRIGQPGFGFYMDHIHGHEKVPQLGRVIIEDHVTIGSNTTIDRGSLHDTVIGQGTMIDNLVQIAHNVRIGRNCVIVAQVGISGSTVIQDYVTIAGQAGLTGHLTIGTGAIIAAQSGVIRNLQPKEMVGGSPAVPLKQWHRQTLVLQRLTQKKGEER